MLDAEKKKIRKEILAVRNALPQEQIEAMSQAICRRFAALPVVQGCSSVMMFLSFGSEVITDYIIEWLWGKKKHVFVPLCKPATRELEIYPLASYADVKPGYIGIREPIKDGRPAADKKIIDLVVVPAVAFDRRGYRVGYGGGYYDRFLAGTNVPTVGLAFSCQIIPEAPVDAYDRSVQGIITEKECIKTG